MVNWNNIIIIMEIIEMIVVYKNFQWRHKWRQKESDQIESKHAQEKNDEDDNDHSHNPQTPPYILVISHISSLFT